MKNRLIIIQLLVIIILLIYRGCEIKRSNDDLLTQVSAYQIGDKAFRVKVQKDSSTIATQSQTILTQKEAIQIGALKLEGEIKKAQSQVRQGQKVIIDSVWMPYIPSNYVDTSNVEWVRRYEDGDSSKRICDSIIAHSLIVPKGFISKNKYYSVYGKVKKDGVMLDSMRLENESSVTIGWKRGGFLKLAKIPIIEVKNSNPYVSVGKLNNFNMKPNKSLFHKKGFWVGVGTFIGLYLHTIL
jgi:hypothetical protein